MTDVVVVAMIDSGGDLWSLIERGESWINSDESLNGRDDDANGYVDDRYGWDFAHGDNDPFDWASTSTIQPAPAGDAISHGTVMSGLVLHSLDGNGSAGSVDAQPVVMLLRVTDSLGPIEVGSLQGAIDYAVAADADVVNLSIGGSWPDDPDPQRSIEAATRTVFVVAAGNGGGPVPPSSPLGRLCISEHVVCVASYDPETHTIGTSQTPSSFGAAVIDLAAPGGPVEGSDVAVATGGLVPDVSAAGAVGDPASWRLALADLDLGEIRGWSCRITSSTWPAEGLSWQEVSVGEEVPDEVLVDPTAEVTCPSADIDGVVRSLEGTSVAAAVTSGQIARWIGVSGRLDAGEDAADIVREFAAELPREPSLASFVHEGRVVPPTTAVTPPRSDGTWLPTDASWAVAVILVGLTCFLLALRLNRLRPPTA
jgi:hypothetical protein